MIRKPGFSHYPIKLGLTSKVGNVEFAFADRFYVRQSGPHEMLDASILAARTAAVACFSSSAPCSWKLVTRNTPYAPLNADARVSGRFKSASTRYFVGE